MLPMPMLAFTNEMFMFAKGDLVQMKSGGPVMTVADMGNYSGYGMGPKDGAKCTWFDKKDDLKEQVFDVAVLEKYEEPDLSSITI